MSSVRRSKQRRHGTSVLLGVGLLTAALFGASGAFGQVRPPAVTSVRLYIFDHGYIRETPDAVRRVFGTPFDPDRIANTLDMSTPFHLIVHPTHLSPTRNFSASKVAEA